MVRTQIYLTHDEKKALIKMAKDSGKKQSVLIREAIDSYIEKSHYDTRLEAIDNAFGLWEDRDDTYSAENVRNSWERGL